MQRLFRFRWILLAIIIWQVLGKAHAQEDTAEAPPVPEIVDTPRTIDPAAFVPPPLAKRATHDFSDSSLREIVEWLQEEQGIAVVLDERALDDVGASPLDPVADRLDDAPIYWLVDRLEVLGLAATYEDNVLYITTAEEIEVNYLTTVPHNVGDLLDQGYKLANLRSAIRNTIAPESWDDVGGSGGLNALGDVLFVRQTEYVQREVQGFLAALRDHGRQTFISEPPQHLRMKEQLDQIVSVDFQRTPLEVAVRQLMEMSGIDIRLDYRELRDVGLRGREPVTLKLRDRPLETVLQAFGLNKGLTWMIRHGVLWITTRERADLSGKTAVYDVRDLCQNRDESGALIDAIISQVEPELWDDVGGQGSIEDVKPGTLVIAQTDQRHAEILNLLETYREALRNSKPRQADQDDLNEVVTVYYRMHAEVARDLAKLLPEMVQPETWKKPLRPEATGTILFAASDPELRDTVFKANQEGESGQAAASIALAQAVLIIRQTRAAHKEIAEVIRRVEEGDPREDEQNRAIRGGFGGGGFGGGGFFRVTEAASTEESERDHRATEPSIR